MSIDQTMHSVFGASKVAADVMVQEYGRYFGLKTACFRGGCLTGPGHSGAELHGFLSYLVKCAVTGRPYTVFGYKGKQVRDNIHSYDLVNAFWHFFNAPRSGEVYNIGGGPHVELLDARGDRASCERLTGRPLAWTYSDTNRAGDHIWWVSDIRQVRGPLPGVGAHLLARAHDRGDLRRDGGRAPARRGAARCRSKSGRSRSGRLTAFRACCRSSSPPTTRKGASPRRFARSTSS